MARFVPTRLRTRLILVVVLALLPASGLVVHAELAQRHNRANQARTEALRVARLSSAHYRQVVEGARQLLVSLAALPELQAPVGADCHAVLAGMLDQFPAYDNIGVIDADGSTACSALPLRGPVDLGDRPYFQQAVATRSLAVGDFQVGRITGKQSVNFGYPVIDRTGSVTGVVFVALDLDWLNGFGAAVSFPQGSTLTILDRNGTVLIRRPDARSFVGNRFFSGPFAGRTGSPAEGTGEFRGLDGVERFYGYTRLARTASGDVSVLVGIPTASVLASANHALARDLVILSLVLLLAVGVAWGAAELLVLRRTRRLAAAARRIGSGELGTQVEGPHGSDEIGELARAFDAMSVGLAERQAERERQAATVADAYAREHEAARRLLELDRLKSEFLAHTSHELRTPLTSLLGFTEMLRARAGSLSPEDLATTLGTVETNAKRLDRLVRDLLDVDRLARGSMSARREKVDLGELARRVVEGADLADEDVAVEVEPTTVAVDVSKIERVVEALLSNAVRHTPPGTPIRVRVKHDDHRASLEVEDEGPGVPDELKRRVFEPFRQGDLAEPWRPGMGIGLTLVRRLVALHGGDVRIEDRAGGGAVVRVWFPHRGSGVTADEPRLGVSSRQP